MTPGQMTTKDYFFIPELYISLSPAQFSEAELRRFPGQYSCYIVFSIVSLAAVDVEFSLK